MNAQRIGFLAAWVGLAASAALGQTERRSAYSYVRETSGDVTVISGLNGTVEARRNLPISAGDEVRTDDPGRAEIALADGNVLHVGGGTSVQFVSLYAQQGSDDDVSALSLKDGSILLSVIGSDEKAVPRIDTEDVAVYTNPGARVRVNADPRRGTAVVVRAGSVEVRTPAGTYTVRAGNYMLAHGEEEPEIARGNFSHDRFDTWAADRLEATYESPRNASSQYVGEDYSSDVASLDGNGNWDYNATYSSYVWRPTVAAGWTPYSNGSWYYTPAGLSWWSYDSWGWYPHHYGNWFFDSGWNSWCWSPGYVYSPAWVYWGYTSSYVGWCPTGWYGPYNSPWWDNYYRNWSYPRNSLAFAVHGNYSTRRVDLRGWNFTGSNGFGTTRGRVDVVPGTRVVDRLGDRLAISSRPIVLGTRNGAGVRESMRDYVREAPRAIERTASRDSDRLEPFLARDPQLPRATVEALRGRTVVSDRGRLSGPGASDIAPRGATIVTTADRGRGAVPIEGTKRIETDRATGRTVLRDGGRAPAAPPSVDRGAHPESRSNDSRSEPADSWRGRSTPSGAETGRPATEAPRSRPGTQTSESWRGNPRAAQPQAAPPASQRFESDQRPTQRSNQDWRSRGDVPPARRVIEGAVPGRRSPEPGDGGGAPQRSYDSAPRGGSPQRSYDSAPRGGSPQRSYDSAPRQAPSAPRGDAPRSIDRAPAPAPAQPSAPRSQPQAPSHAAPPPSHSAPPPARSGPPPSAPRSAPPSSSGRPGGRP